MIAESIDRSQLRLTGHSSAHAWLRREDGGHAERPKDLHKCLLLRLRREAPREVASGQESTASARNHGEGPQAARSC